MTNEQDVGTDMVVRSLRRREVPYLRINTERLPNSAVTVEDGRVTVTSRLRGRQVLDDVGWVWLRQPVWPAWPFPAGEAEVLSNQWRALVRGLAVLDASWMNPVDAGLACEAKLVQLKTAGSVGFATPPTLVTNDMTAARSFVAEVGPAVVKALDAPWFDDATDGRRGEVAAGGGSSAGRFVFTQRVTDELLGERGLEVVPLIFQQEVCGKRDVRVMGLDPSSWTRGVIG